MEINKMESKTKREWMDIIAERAMSRVRYAVEVMRCWMFPDQQTNDEDRNLSAWGQKHGITPEFIKDVFFSDGGMLEGELPHVGLNVIDAHLDEVTDWMQCLDDKCSDGIIYWAAALDEVLTKADWDVFILKGFVHMTEVKYYRLAEKSYKDRMFDVLKVYGELDPEMRMHKQVCDWLVRQLDESNFMEIVIEYELDAGWEAGEDERFEDEVAYNNAMFERATEWVTDYLTTGRGDKVFGTWSECATALIRYCSNDQVRYTWDILELEQYEWL